MPGQCFNNRGFYYMNKIIPRSRQEFDGETKRSWKVRLNFPHRLEQLSLCCSFTCSSHLPAFIPWLLRGMEWRYIVDNDSKKVSRQFLIEEFNGLYRKVRSQFKGWNGVILSMLTGIWLKYDIENHFYWDRYGSRIFDQARSEFLSRCETCCSEFASVLQIAGRKMMFNAQRT